MVIIECKLWQAIAVCFNLQAFPVYLQLHTYKNLPLITSFLTNCSVLLLWLRNLSRIISTLLSEKLQCHILADCLLHYSGTLVFFIALLFFHQWRVALPKAFATLLLFILQMRVCLQTAVIRTTIQKERQSYEVTSTSLASC